MSTVKAKSCENAVIRSLNNDPWSQLVELKELYKGNINSDGYDSRIYKLVRKLKDGPVTFTDYVYVIQDSELQSIFNLSILPDWALDTIIKKDYKKKEHIK